VTHDEWPLFGTRDHGQCPHAKRSRDGAPTSGVARAGRGFSQPPKKHIPRSPSSTMMAVSVPDAVDACDMPQEQRGRTTHRPKVENDDDNRRHKGTASCLLLRRLASPNNRCARCCFSLVGDAEDADDVEGSQRRRSLPRRPVFSACFSASAFSLRMVAMRTSRWASTCPGARRAASSKSLAAPASSPWSRRTRPSL
jgi:hypothetical protein